MAGVTFQIETPKGHGRFLRFDLRIIYGGIPLMVLKGVRLKRDGTLVPAQHKLPTGGGYWDHWKILDEQFEKAIVAAVQKTPEWRTVQRMATAPEPAAF